MRDDLAMLIKELEMSATSSRSPSSGSSTGKPARASGSPPSELHHTEGTLTLSRR